MGKKKAAHKPKGRPKSAHVRGRTPIAVTIRAGEEWRDWVDRARHELSRQGYPLPDRTGFLDHALILMAKHLGMELPPPRLGED